MTVHEWPHQVANKPFVPKWAWRSEDVSMQIFVPESWKMDTLGIERIRVLPLLSRGYLIVLVQKKLKVYKPWGSRGNSASDCYDRVFLSKERMHED